MKIERCISLKIIFHYITKEQIFLEIIIAKNMFLFYNLQIIFVLNIFLYLS